MRSFELQSIIKLLFGLYSICFNRSRRGNGSSRNNRRFFLTMLRRGRLGLFDMRTIHLKSGSVYYGVKNALLNVVKEVS